MDKFGHGIYTPMDINLLPPLFLIYADNPSDSGKVDICMDSIICSIFHLYYFYLWSSSLFALALIVFDRSIKLMRSTSVNVLEKPKDVLLLFLPSIRLS